MSKFMANSTAGAPRRMSMQCRMGLAALSMAMGSLSPTASAAPNKAPTVSITSPTAGASFSAPASISLSANAADADGTVTKVAFYLGTTLIGTSSSTASPYTFQWNNVAAGSSYSLTAKATDNAGAVATSAAVSVTVSAAASNAITVASPVNASVVYGDALTVSGSFVGDAGSTVWVDNGDSMRLATLSGSTYSATLPLYSGANAIKVTLVRRDKTSASINLALTGGSLPVVTFSSQPMGDLAAPANITLAVEAFSPTGSISKVSFYNGATLLSDVPAEPYQYVWSNVTQGTYTVTAKAFDNLGVTASADKTIEVLGPNGMPQVGLTSPVDGAVFSMPASILISANANDADGSIAGVEFFQNGNLLSASNIAPFSFNWATAAVGSYSLVARATDNRGGTTSSTPVNITVSPPNNAPAVSLTAPLADSLFYVPGSITLSANASDSDGQVASVQFYQGSTLLGTSQAPPYSFTWASPAAGNYALSARATDNLGGITNSAPINVTVSGPSVVYTGPGPATNWVAPATITLSANASPSNAATVVKVEFFEGANLIGMTSSAPYTLSWPDVEAGTYQMSAKVTDSRGTTATSSVSALTIAAAPFSAGISSPANNSRFLVSTPVSVVLKAFSQTSTIAKLQLYDGAVLIETYAPSGQTNGLTYTTTWTPTTAGSHALSVKATDAQGALISSTVKNVTVLSPADLPTIAFRTAGKFYVERGYVDFIANANPPAGATLQRVEFLSGTTVIATMTAAPYNMTWVAGPGNYVLSARAVDSLGGSTQSAPVAITVQAAPGLAIAPGLDGSSVNARSIHLRGTIEAPPNSAIDANGKLGVIGSDGKFFVLDVPLQPGTNTISVTVRTFDHQVKSSTISVTSTGEELFSFTADVPTGTSSVETQFSLTKQAGVQIGRAELSCIEGTAISATVTSLSELASVTCNYGTPGVYTAAIRVFDAASALIYSGNQSIYVASANEVGKLARGAFTGLISRLKDGNIALAVSSASPLAQEHFNDLFANLGPDLPAALEQFGTVSRIGFTSDTAELVLHRGEGSQRSAFLIYIARGADGIWRIVSM